MLLLSSCLRQNKNIVNSSKHERFWARSGNLCCTESSFLQTMNEEIQVLALTKLECWIDYSIAFLFKLSSLAWSIWDTQYLKVRCPLYLPSALPWVTDPKVGMIPSLNVIWLKIYLSRCWLARGMAMLSKIVLFLSRTSVVTFISKTEGW